MGTFRINKSGNFYEYIFDKDKSIKSAIVIEKNSIKINNNYINFRYFYNGKELFTIKEINNHLIVKNVNDNITLICFIDIIVLTKKKDLFVNFFRKIINGIIPKIELKWYYD